ncbi:MAG: hypothetical protein LBQ67_06590 [Treponema sp.]|jgi:hypothetical protein|nr:hypothetical protein [Treponema sp.]
MREAQQTARESKSEEAEVFPKPTEFWEKFSNAGFWNHSLENRSFTEPPVRFDRVSFFPSFRYDDP